MRIERKSAITGIRRARSIDVTYEQIQQWEVEGKPIEQVMSHLSDEEREFIMSGITGPEWNMYIGENTDHLGKDG